MNEPADGPAAAVSGPAALGRLGEELERLLGWPPVAPAQVRALHLAGGAGLAAGRAEADALADSGVDLVLLDADGDPVIAVVAIAVLLDLEPVAALGTQPTPEWAGQVVRIRTGLTAARQHLADPAQLVGDGLLGRLTGLLEGCAARRTPVVLGGGTLVAAAALVAHRLAPAAPRWWLAGERATSVAGRAAFSAVGLEPLLDIGVTAGGPQLTWALLRAGIETAGG